MPYYLDTSAAVKLVVAERETAALTAWLDSHDVISSDLLRTELLRATRRAAPEQMMRARQVIDAIPLLTVPASTFDRATDLVQTILTTRAGEHRALKLHLEIVELHALLGDLHELYKPAAEERGLRLDLDVPEQRWVLLDRQRINQAIANLLDNALAYTPRGGSVTLALRVHDDKVRIVVLDSGPGLSPTDLTKIWQRHTRGSAATANTPGMGLGLALVRALAHAHHGNAGCRNRDEGGAEFWIELPAGDPLASANGV